jgi:hypothetical protein
MIWTFPENGAPLAPYPVFRLGPFWACETADGTLALAGKFPWGQWPSFADLPSKPAYYKGFRGWEAGLWHDGPEFMWDGRAVTACVLPGTDAELPSRFQKEGFDAWLKEHEVLAWKKSLAKAFRGRYALTQGAFRLHGLENHATHALVLLGLRLAFPSTQFMALDYPADCKPQWKRYCQNLNMTTWAAPSQLQGLPVLDTAEMARVWPEADASRFLLNLNARIPCIPGKLATLFNSP